MGKTDFTRLYKAYYTARDKPELILIAPALYLSLPGAGDPSAAAFARNTQTLYSVAYAIKFRFKDQGMDFTMPKLEGLWWFEEDLYPGLSLETAPQRVPRSAWFYRLLLRMPEETTPDMVADAITSVQAKKGITFPTLPELYAMNEGHCVQMLHTGPFGREPETLAQMKVFMEDYQFIRNGLHHEIYLSDFRKTAADKLKTILREPVRR